jgi:hypothetical protein
MAYSRQKSVFFKAVSCLVGVCFLATNVVSPAYAQSIVLPVNSVLNPTIMRGLTIDPQDPLHFNFIISQGSNNSQDKEFKAESEKIVKYFLASLTVPEDEMWVNLSPVEKNRIISEGLGKTELGKDMLGQDYLLKQFTASLMSPDKELGEKFWNKVKEQAKANDVDISNYNKVWIVVPNIAVMSSSESLVQEKEGMIVLNKTFLKSMFSILSAEKI